MGRSGASRLIDALTYVSAEIVVKAISGLQNAINGAPGQCLNRCLASFACQAGQHDNRHRSRPHKACQKFKPTHPRHFNIQRQHICSMCFQNVSGLDRIGSLANDIEAAIR